MQPGEWRPVAEQVREALDREQIAVYDVFTPADIDGRPDALLALESRQGSAERAAAVARRVDGVARADRWGADGLLGLWLTPQTL